ncbi:MAG TPA: LLM class flavin-dependent oxidoreductase [Thermomicrobiales bacterium]|jgi:alkanesulfonate monooxygenase SsuD/methylene tetrahydromethanopterin reductase-like flavin-dependent oxidoreductase (luciferase family)
MRAPTFGIQTIPNRPYADLVAQWRDCEALGFDSLWLPDHFVPVFRPELPFFETWTLLAGLTTVTSRVRVGVLVSCNTFRHPALLAKQAATVDHISGGRLELGLGAGWVEFEHRMFGLRYPDDGERVAMFREAVEVVDRLLRNDVTSFDGTHYHLRVAPFRPAPVQRPRPPLTLAANGPQMLRFIAPYADRWNSLGTAEQLRERGARLDDACAAIGRNPREILRSVLYVAAIMTAEHPWDSLDAFRDFVGRYRDAGIEEFLLQPPPDEKRAVFERIALDVIPSLRNSS